MAYPRSTLIRLKTLARAMDLPATVDEREEKKRRKKKNNKVKLKHKNVDDSDILPESDDELGQLQPRSIKQRGI